MSGVETPAARVEAAPAQRRLEWYRRMVEIRLFENKTQELFLQG